MTEEKTDEQKRTEEYESEFKNLAAGGKPSDKAPESDKKDAKAPKEEELETEEKEKDPPAPGSESESSEDNGDPEAGDDPEDEPETDKESDKGLAKALKDTKAWATQIAMDKAKLEKELADLKAGRSTDEKVKDAKDTLAETRKTLAGKLESVYKDYPELKDVLDPLISMTDALSGKVQSFEKVTEEESKRSELRQKFETEIEPEIIKVHPDFRKVAFSKEYMAWVEKQSPATQYAAMNSLDPDDIIGTITKFKKANAGGEAESQRQEEERKKKGLKENLASVRGGGSGSKTSGKPSRFEDIDPNDREGAWEYLAAQEEKRKAKK